MLPRLQLLFSPRERQACLSKPTSGQPCTQRQILHLPAPSAEQATVIPSDQHKHMQMVPLLMAGIFFMHSLHSWEKTSAAQSVHNVRPNFVTCAEIVICIRILLG